MGKVKGMGEVSEWNASESCLCCVRSFLTGGGMHCELCTVCDYACDFRQIGKERESGRESCLATDQDFDERRSSTAKIQLTLLRSSTAGRLGKRTKMHRSIIGFVCQSICCANAKELAGILPAVGHFSSSIVSNYHFIVHEHFN